MWQPKEGRDLEGKKQQKKRKKVVKVVGVSDVGNNFLIKKRKRKRDGSKNK